MGNRREQDRVGYDTGPRRVNGRPDDRFSRYDKLSNSTC